jgi:hypothetical protein
MTTKRLPSPSFAQRRQNIGMFEALRGKRSHTGKSGG